MGEYHSGFYSLKIVDGVVIAKSQIGGAAVAVKLEPGDLLQFGLDCVDQANFGEATDAN